METSRVLTDSGRERFENRGYRGAAKVLPIGEIAPGKTIVRVLTTDGQLMFNAAGEYLHAVHDLDFWLAK